jgi:hypothetical protein
MERSLRLWLDSLRLWRAARSYGRDLRSQLWQSYGGSRGYTAPQIRRAAEALGLDLRCIALGYAAFLPRQEYEALAPSLPIHVGYDRARQMFDRAAACASPLAAANADSFSILN